MREAKRTSLVAFIALFFPAAFLAVLHPDRQPIRSIGYGFGVLATNLAKGAYAAPEPHAAWGSYILHAHRMPLLPALLAPFAAIGAPVWIALLFKNALGFALIAMAIRRLSPESPRWIALLGALFLNPIAYQDALSIDTEEGLLIPLLIFALGLLFTLRSAKSAGALGAAIAALYLCKSSMILVCAVLALTALALLWRSHRNWAVIPGLALLAAMLGWGIFCQVQTGRFAIGTDSSSWNGWNYAKGNNQWFASYYPYRNLDELDDSGRLDPPTKWSSEWEMNDSFMDLGHAFNLAEPAQERKNFLAKLSMGLWRLDGMKQNATVPPGKIWPQVLIARLWVLALIGLSVARRQWKVLGLFALLYASILVPYVAGFGYHRHYAPIYAVASFLSIWLLLGKPRRYVEPARSAST